MHKTRRAAQGDNIRWRVGKIWLDSPGEGKKERKEEVIHTLKPERSEEGGYLFCHGAALSQTFLLAQPFGRTFFSASY